MPNILTDSTVWNRDRAIEDARPILWLYLSASAAINRNGHAPGRAIDAADDLSVQDLRRLLAAHLSVSGVTAEALAAAATLLRGLPASVNRTKTTEYGLVKGRVDWQRTLERRAVTSDPTVFECEPIDKRYDTPLGRLIRLSLAGIEDLRHQSRLAQSQTLGTVAHQITVAEQRAAKLLRNPKLHQVRPVRSTQIRHIDRVLARNPEATPLWTFANRYHEPLLRGDPDALRRLLEEQTMSPSENDQIFELSVGLAILEALTAMGLELVGPCTLVQPYEATVPFATMGAPGHGRWQIWWQRNLWAAIDQPGGRWRQVLTDNAIENKQPLRPDFVAEFQPATPADSRRIVLVEVKLTDKPGTRERDGLRDMLAYLADCEPFIGDEIDVQGLVVAWNATGTPTDMSRRVVVSSQERLEHTLSRLLGRLP